VSCRHTCRDRFYFNFLSFIAYSTGALLCPCRHSSRVVAFFQAVATPKFRRPRSASIARTEPSVATSSYLSLSVWRYLSDGRCKGSVYTATKCLIDFLCVVRKCVRIQHTLCYLWSHEFVCSFHRLLARGYYGKTTHGRFASSPPGRVQGKVSHFWTFLKVCSLRYCKNFIKLTFTFSCYIKTGLKSLSSGGKTSMEVAKRPGIET